MCGGVAADGVGLDALVFRGKKMDILIVVHTVSFNGVRIDLRGNLGAALFYERMVFNFWRRFNDYSIRVVDRGRGHFDRSCNESLQSWLECSRAQRFTDKLALPARPVDNNEYSVDSICQPSFPNSAACDPYFHTENPKRLEDFRVGDRLHRWNLCRRRHDLCFQGNWLPVLKPFRFF